MLPISTLPRSSLPRSLVQKPVLHMFYLNSLKSGFALPQKSNASVEETETKMTLIMSEDRSAERYLDNIFDRISDILNLLSHIAVTDYIAVYNHIATTSILTDRDIAILLDQMH